MNELELQVRQIKQHVKMNSPEWLILKLLDTLEAYVAGEPEAAQHSVQRTADNVWFCSKGHENPNDEKWCIECGRRR